MEAIDFVGDIINNLGFPIAMVIYFIWDKYKNTSALTEAINNNTTILTQILEHFRKDVNDDE